MGNFTLYFRIKLNKLAFFINLLLRLAWVLSISPDVIAQIIRPELITFGIGLAEIIRRSIWNFLRY